MQRTSQEQVQHIQQVAQAADAKAEHMHREAQHYAAEALQHHNHSVFRARQTINMGLEATQKLETMEAAESRERQRTLQLEQNIATTNMRQQ